MAERQQWYPTLGAIVTPGTGTRFQVWSPPTSRADLVIETPGRAVERRPLERDAAGMFHGAFSDLGPGLRYRYLLDGDGPFPDPASRYQPDGVHGPSSTVDPSGFAWSDAAWTGVPIDSLVVYELHVGTFSPSGTFAGVTEQLPRLADLGVTAIELMPVADFPGMRNWGYDGAALFAPARCYGHPDDLRRLVDAAHGCGLGVFLDVVYNHTGPDGAYLSRFSPYYFTTRHASPWGAGIDLDGEQSTHVREFFIENALYWIHEYHFDGLRLDATHAIEDASPTHFLAELGARVRQSVAGRRVQLIAEDHRNLSTMVMATEQGGWGLDGVWADDLHHQMRRLLAGDHDGYYRDFSGTTGDVAATLRQGWFFTGQYSTHLGERRGTDPASIAAHRFVVCLQNHDQVGNRARGDRLHHQIDLAAFRAASTILLTLPQTPLIFMGQEWAASSPFQYFTDHAEPLGRLVTEGRRKEFRDFAAFAGDAANESIPDPQALTTFLASRLDWGEREVEPHASMLRFYTALLAFRRTALAPGGAGSFTAEALDEDTIALRRHPGSGTAVVVVARFRGAGLVDLGGHPLTADAVGWNCLLSSEDAAFSPTPMGPVVDCAGARCTIRFDGPAAVILSATATEIP